MHVHFYQRSCIISLAVTLLLVSGCNKKKPQVPAAQTQAPTVTQPTPQQQQEPATTTPTPAPEVKAQKPSPIKRHKATAANGQKQPATGTTAKKTPPPAT